MRMEIVITIAPETLTALQRMLDSLAACRGPAIPAAPENIPASPPEAPAAAPFDQTPVQISGDREPVPAVKADKAKRPNKWAGWRTPERFELFGDMYQKNIPMETIRAAMMALPGPPVPDSRTLFIRAADYKLKRNRELAQPVIPPEADLVSPSGQVIARRAQIISFAADRRWPTHPFDLDLINKGCRRVGHPGFQEAPP